MAENSTSSTPNLERRWTDPTDLSAERHAHGIAKLPPELLSLILSRPMLPEDDDRLSANLVNRSFHVNIEIPRSLTWKKAEEYMRDGQQDRLSACSREEVRVIGFPESTMLGGSLRPLRQTFPRCYTFECVVDKDDDPGCAAPVSTDHPTITAALREPFGWPPHATSRKGNISFGSTYELKVDPRFNFSIRQSMGRIPLTHHLSCSADRSDARSNARLLARSVEFILAHHVDNNRLPRTIQLSFDGATSDHYKNLADSKLPLLVSGRDGAGYGGLVLSSNRSSPSLAEVLAVDSLWDSTKTPGLGLVSSSREVVMDVSVDGEPLPTLPPFDTKSRIRKLTFRLGTATSSGETGPVASVATSRDLASNIAKAFRDIKTRYPVISFEPRDTGLTRVCSDATRLVREQRAFSSLGRYS